MNSNKSTLNSNNRYTIQPKLVGILVFIFFCILFSFIISQQYNIAKKNKNDEMNRILQTIHKTIDNSLKKNYVDALTLALTINDKGVPENFENVGKHILASNSNIDAVQLVPNGIIRYTYPLKGNEAAIGLNILKSGKIRNEAMQSVKNKKMYFAGPFELKQGGLGIVGRVPIYKQGKLWGFSAVIIRLNTLLKIPEIDNIDPTKYDFQLSKINPTTKKEDFFFNTKQNVNTNNSISAIIPDVNWKLYLVNKKPNTLIFPIVVHFFLALLLAFLISFLTTSFFKKPAELKRLLFEQANVLLKNEIKFKSIFDQAPLGITYIDYVSGKFLEVNKKFTEITGYSLEEAKLMVFEALTHPEDLEQSLLYLEKLYKGEIREYFLEKRYIKKSGEFVWVSITVSPLWEINETPTNFVVIIKDISQRKKTNEIIHNSRQRIESLINTVDGIVWECDAETLEFTFISKKVKDILGYSAEEWIQDSSFWANHIHPEDRNNSLKFCQEQINQLKNHVFEYRMIAKNGSIIWLRDIVNVIIENGKAKSLRGIMIDITKNKEIEKDLNSSFNIVSEQNKRLLNFSYIVSHNLRSHTSNITSIVDIISTSDCDDEKEEMIQLLKSVSDSLNDTMMNLNEVINIQTNIGLITENLNLKQYIDNTLCILSDQIESKGTTIISTIENNTEVSYNPAYLESILYNLISNAIRYSHSEKKPTITIDFFTEDDKKVLQIADNGIGIDLNKNGHKIFGMYKTFSNHKDSKGIGLFITKNQIDAMGGNITVESIPNQGTTFKVYMS